MQIKVSGRMQLDKMLESCLEERCRTLQQEALDVIERVSDRKMMDTPEQAGKVYGSKGKGRKFDFILEPEEFIARRLTTVEEAVTFEAAAACMEDCRRPIDIVKRIMNSNIQEVQKNLKSCMSSCSTEYKLPGSGLAEGKDPTDDKVFSKEIFSCQIKCMEGTKEIMKACEAEMGQTLPKYRTQMQEII